MTDITYLYCAFGTAYLSAIKGSLTKEILAYTVRNDMTLRLSLDVIKQLNTDKLEDGSFIHSDLFRHFKDEVDYKNCQSLEEQ